ncbi:hypothetical protein ACET3Z_016241 [Daucus carota]
MAAIKHLISQSRRNYFPLAHLLRSHTSLRSLCSQVDSPNLNPNSDESQSQPPEPSRYSQPVVPQTISYPVKPKPEPEPTEPPIQTQNQNQNPQFRGSEWQNESDAGNAGVWSREDFRYVKDMAPVSYQTRVAPLPEDRKEESNESRENVEMRNRENEERVRRRVFRIYEEEKLPFPTLIKQDVEKKAAKEKVIYDLKEAIHLLKASTKCKFDETLEAHVKMTPDLRRTDLKLIGTASLPHGTGKPVRIAVFAEGGAADEARAAGADVVGGEDLIEGIKNGSIKVDFDKCISTPQLMSRVSKEISKILRRSTPNAKDGTVTTDLSRVVREAKQNVNFRKDKSAIVHVGLGKISFSEDALRENVGAFVNALLLAKPAGLKKSSKFAGYVGTFHLCSTMGRSYPISIQSLSIAADRYNKMQMR